MFWERKTKVVNSNSGNIFIKLPPKTNEYKTISTLLDDAERWRNIGDKELEKKTWQMIAEKASLYADGMRESYEVYSKCGVVGPAIRNLKNFVKCPER